MFTLENVPDGGRSTVPNSTRLSILVILDDGRVGRAWWPNKADPYTRDEVVARLNILLDWHKKDKLIELLLSEPGLLLLTPLEMSQLGATG